MPGVQPRRLFEVAPEEDDGEAEQDLRFSTFQYNPAMIYKNTKKTYHTVVERVSNPEPECGLGEERVALTEHVQLRVPIQNPSRDELVEDTNDEGRQDGEDDVIHRERP